MATDEMNAEYPITRITEQLSCHHNTSQGRERGCSMSVDTSTRRSEAGLPRAVHLSTRAIDHR
jgi:hypothetical protein